MSSALTTKRLRASLASRAVKKPRIEGDSPADHGQMTLQSYLSSRFCDSVMEIINDLLMTPSEAILKAARLGCVGWLEKLLSRAGYEATTEAAVAAVSNGHAEALKLLYAGQNWCGDLGLITQQILAVAAERGSIEVVEFLATHFAGYYKLLRGSALIKAIARGDIDMVALLLDAKTFTWDFEEAVTKAIAGEQSAIVELIHRKFPYYDRGPYTYHNTWHDALIVCMARKGQTHIVKYLYEHKLWSTESLGRAFEAAASCGCDATLEFLHGTGSISPQAFDGGFVAAAEAKKLDTLRFLYSKQVASVEAVNLAFEATGSPTIVVYLYDTGLISLGSLTNVLQGSCVGRRSWSRRESEAIIRHLLNGEAVPTELIPQAAIHAANSGDADLVAVFYDSACYSTDAIIDAFKTAIARDFDGVVKVLGRAECITDEILSEAFVESVKRGQASIVFFLLRLDRVSSEVITEAFVAATKGWHTTVVHMLFKQQQASAEEIGHLLQRAVRAGHFPIARTLIKSPRVSQKMKDDALLTVAQDGKSGSKKFISTSDCWSQEILAQALEIATEVRGVKRVLAKMINRN